MGRYLGPISKQYRREGIPTEKTKKEHPPGAHGLERGPKMSDYAKQLRAKQKARRIYGISEKHLRKYYTFALKSKTITGEEMIRQIERRLDNVVYRCGFARTRRQSRQLVSHGIVKLNGRRVTVPSIQVGDGDEISIRDQNKAMPLFEAFEKRKLIIPSWLSVDQEKLAAHVLRAPQKEDMEQSLETHMIIEFYSRV